MKHRKNTTNDITVMQSIIDSLNVNNKELQAEVNRLRTELIETNTMNIKADEDDKNYRNLVQLNTLLMVIMNMVTAHVDDSPLGQAVGKAVKKYQLTMAKYLSKGTVYIKDEDMNDWKDEDDEY